MLVVGLTGSIGMGKTAIAGFFREHGVAVFDADGEVHRLYDGLAVGAIEAAFPGSTANGRVDRAKLAAQLIDQPQGFKRLEAIVHPLVRAAESSFLDAQARRGAPLAVLEIPLLFETGADALVDVTIVVSAAADVQRKRVMERAGMTAAKYELILGRQMSDAEKRRRADFVVDTGGTLVESEAQIAHIISVLRTRKGQAFKTHWSGKLDKAR